MYVVTPSLFLRIAKNNFSTWPGPGGATKKKIDYLLIGRKHRNWITNLNNKHIDNPRQSKQRKIILAHFQIKLKITQLQI